MIPFSIMSGNIIWAEESVEIRILDLSIDSFTFRLPGRYDFLMEKVSAFFILYFFQYETYTYKKVILKDYELQIEEEESTRYYRVYRVYTEDVRYQEAASFLMKEYLRYIEWKQESSPEEIWANSRTETKGQPVIGGKDCLPLPDLAYAMMDHKAYEIYLSQEGTDGLLERYQEKAYAKKEPFLLHQKIKALYIGNPYCPHLFPKKDTLLAMLDKCIKESLQPVIVFSVMKEEKIDEIREILHVLQVYWRKQREADKSRETLELVINDWGMLTMIRKEYRDTFQISMGNLLHKRRKDSRIADKRGFETYQDLFLHTSIDAKDYRDYLEENYGISHYVYETCGYLFNMVSGSDLYLPFYQMNTSGHCVLYAVCKNGSREKQVPLTECEGLCMQYGFSYDEKYQITGRYNTLFGYDEKIWKEEEYLKHFLKQRPRRMVLQLLD